VKVDRTEQAGTGAFVNRPAGGHSWSLLAIPPGRECCLPPPSASVAASRHRGQDRAPRGQTRLDAGPWQSGCAGADDPDARTTQPRVV